MASFGLQIVSKVDITRVEELDSAVLRLEAHLTGQPEHKLHLQVRIATNKFE